MNTWIVLLIIFLFAIVVGEIVYLRNPVKIVSYNKQVPTPTPTYSLEKALSLLKNVPLLTLKYMIGYISTADNPLITASYITVESEGKISSISTSGGKFDPNLPDTFAIEIVLMNEKNQTITTHYVERDLPLITIVGKEDGKSDISLKIEDLKKGDTLFIQEVYSLKIGKTDKISIRRISSAQQ